MTVSPSADASPAAAATPPEPSAIAVPSVAAAPDPAFATELVAEDAAWAEVLAGWQDEARHRAYLARFDDLDGLAAAGGRYRAVLAARPGDAIAARFRDEVVRRAMAQGLASLPRSEPSRPRARLAIRVAAGAVVAALVVAAAVMVARLVPLLASGGARP